MGIEAIKSIPYLPFSHPFVERLIGTIRRKVFDRLLFWNAPDLERELHTFKTYYNGHRVLSSLKGQTPDEISAGTASTRATLERFSWRPHCRGLFYTPVVA